MMELTEHHATEWAPQRFTLRECVRHLPRTKALSKIRASLNYSRVQAELRYEREMESQLAEDLATWRWEWRP